MHICFSKLTTIGSDNGLSPGWHQAIIWTSARILLIQALGTNFNEILSKSHTFSFKKMHLKMSSAKWQQFCLGLNVLMLLFWVLLMSMILHHFKDSIAVTMHKYHGISDHWQFDCFFQQLVQADHKESTKAPNYWPFVSGIHCSLDCPHKRP